MFLLIRNLSLAITLSCSAHPMVAQLTLSDWQSSTAWTNGTIITNDDEELSGKLRYDDLQSILFYRSGLTEKTFTSRQVKMFRLTDSLKRSDRLFYALEFEDRKSNIKRPLFFELIKEFKTFAVLSKVDPVEFKEPPAKPRASPYATRDIDGTMRIQQFETICFMSLDGLIEPYLEIETTIKNGISLERHRNKETVLNADLLVKYFGASAKDKIMIFMNHNGFQLNRRDDFLQMLEYYEKYLAN